MRQKNHKLHTYFLHIIYFLHISHVESFFHMTICHVEHFSTWQSVMWRNFSTWQKNSPQAPPVMPVTNIRYASLCPVLHCCPFPLMQHLNWPQSRVEAPVKSWLSKFWKIPNLCLSFQVVVLVSNGLVSIGSTSRLQNLNFTTLSPANREAIKQNKMAKVGILSQKGGRRGVGIES